jgi:hypothetical protein
VDTITGSEAGDGSSDDDARRGAIRTFLVAMGLTPMMLVSTTTGSLGEISAETVVSAGLVGATVGVPAFLLVDRLDFRHVNDAVALVVMLALVVVAVVVTWLVVPPGATQTFAVGCVAFLWAMALGGVSRHVVWPRVTAETG